MDTWGAPLYGDPCRGCGFRWNADRDATISLMRNLPDWIEGIVTGANGKEELPDLGWNVSGYIAHMTDNTRIWAERLIGVARGADPRVVPYDPDLLAESRHYNETALEGVTWSFRLAVEGWLAALEEAEPVDVVILHSERGSMEIADVIASNVHDAYHHRWDLTRILGNADQLI